MSIGQERDAIEHPGRESFDGEIARFLMFGRSLSDEEMRLIIKNLKENYRIK